MKYYIYISDAKLDMLYPQIPKPLLHKIAGDLNINLKLFGVDIGISTKKESVENTRYEKVKLVSKFIEENYKVGTIDNPGKSWFKGTALMSWSPVTLTEAVYFGGKTKHSYFGLGGSRKHIIGNTSRDSVSADYGMAYGSQSPQLIDILNKRYKIPPPKDPNEHVILEETAWYAQDILKAMPKQKMEFLALKYCHDTIDVRENKNEIFPYHVVLGTPLYVALVE